ncbi:RecT family protein [Paenibacillus sp. 32O-W]|uniref:recombinase RecT n=1 Tax=Paenibacillus sp. 32O-W TaxID=1695218 RepID=UPI0007217DE8|nr:recombinase RecT [Paenibacillus sp. 32O-W]ALS27162.1 RecT family protein [Paenibacillus sp. 32O-W]
MSNQLALIKRDTVDVVAEKVREFQSRGEIHFPANYSPENAMKAAWLILQSTADRNGKPALEVCTRDSIANALLDMVVQGLNPAKKQGYFIVYGRQLVFQRSYFGTMAVTKRVTGAKDIFAQVVYEGDEFEFEINLGKKRVLKHVQTLKSLSSGKIVAAYCTIIFPDDREYTDIMTMEEIRQSWKKSRQNPEKEGSTHQEFPQEMAKRTVINRTCKGYLNSSDDGSLLMYHFRRQDELIAESEVEAEIAENANREPIDVEAYLVTGQEDVSVQHQPADDQVSDPLDDGQGVLDFEEPAAAGAGPGF